MEKFDLYLITGNVGTGKTTAGRKIQAELGIQLYDPDLMRREMGLIKHRPEDTSLVMAEIWRGIYGTLASSQSAILCTPYVRRQAREQGYEKLRMMEAEFRRRLKAVLIRCECPEHLAKSRMMARPASDQFHLPSNQPAVYDRYKNLDDPIDSSEILKNTNISFLTLDTEENDLRPMVIRSAHEIEVRTIRKILTGLK